MYDPNAKPEEPQLSRRQQIKQAHANRMNNQAVKKHGEEQVQAFYNAQQNPAPAPALNANQQANQQAVQQHGQGAVNQYYTGLQNQQAVNQHGQQAVQDFYGALQGGGSPFGALNQAATGGAGTMYDPNKGASKKTEQPAVQPKLKAVSMVGKVGPGDFNVFDYMAQARDSAPMSNSLGMALAGGGAPFGGGFSNPALFGNQMMFGGYSPMGMGGFGGYNPMAQVPMGMGALLGGFNRSGWGY